MRRRPQLGRDAQPRLSERAARFGKPRFPCLILLKILDDALQGVRSNGRSSLKHIGITKSKNEAANNRRLLKEAAES